jgi:hypothetical protein
MKTNEMRTITVSKSLEEVWEWKQKVYEETKGKSFSELNEIYFRGMQEAAKILNAQLLKNENGTYRFV